MSLRFLLSDAWHAWHYHSSWMAWNLFLAFIPLALSVLLFRRSSGIRNFFWWVGLIVFIAFLPNAPYLLTDIIHLIDAVRHNYSVWIITLVLIPQHLSAILLGFQAYVISLINLGYFLQKQKLAQLILPAELITHALCAVGIYLGRFLRFNSWDLVTQPEDLAQTIVDDLTAKLPVLVMFITFIILTLFYWLMKQITLGLILKIRYRKLLHESD